LEPRPKAGKRSRQGAFGALLSRHRVAANLTQEHLAERAGLSTEAVGALERGDRLTPWPSTVERLAEALRLNARQRDSFIAASRAGRGPDPGVEYVRPGAVCPPGSLPVHLTRFVGRERELVETRLLLQKARVLTVTGAGGCGKTRFVVEAVGEVVHRYPGGVWFVGLGSVGDPDVVPVAVAEALGIAPREGVDSLDAIGATLAGVGARACLIIVDNCEHMLGRCAEVIDALLRASSNVAFACTSREPLHLAGEVIWQLEPLQEPDAVELFVDRAALSDPGFRVTGENADTVTQLCRHLDGLPLALELAAAHVRLQSIDELTRGLERRFSAVSPRSVAPRQRTLSATIGWSYELLQPVESRLLRRLSVFRGGFTLAAAETVCGDDGDEDAAFQLLARLADKSLVSVVPPHRERYRCLEIIRRFALDRLVETGELDAIRARHVAWFLALAERAAAELTGADQRAWLDRLADDHDNLRAALEASHGADVEVRLRLVLALERFWFVRGYLGERRKWVEDALAAATGLGATALRARVIDAAARLALEEGDPVRAQRWLETGLSIWQEIGDRAGVQSCLSSLGVAALRLGDWPAARTRFEESLEIARALGSRRAIAVLLINLGVTSAFLDDHETASAQLEEALTATRSLSDPAQVATALANLGMVALHRGRVAEATDRYTDCLRILESLAAPGWVAECLEGFACIAARCADPERAMRLAGAAAGIRETMGRPQPQWSRRLQEEWIGEARQLLGPAADLAWHDGRMLPAERSVSLALGRTPGTNIDTG
jgi:non-specific serine/threonine protein kinase